MKLVLCILGVFFLKLATCQEIVETNKPKAKIKGHTLKSSTGRVYYAFQQIPYAMSPARLGAPKVAADSSVIIDATKNTKICMQGKNPHNMTMTEDCLYLNVYTPRKPTKLTKIPVVLWIHPGNFMEGSGAFQYYNPEYWMDHDVVVVTINYRLGAFGFLYLGDNTIPGNIGLRDQAMALQWVNNNINVFGGNPDNIGLVGHGAGAASIAYHYQLGRALSFDCGIMQSGSSLDPQWYQPNPSAYAKKLVLKLNPKFDFKVSGAGKLALGVIHKATPQQLLQLSEELTKEEASKGINEHLVWLPTVESYMLSNPYITDSMFDAWLTGDVQPVRTMYGFTSGEMAGWASKNNLLALAKKYDASPASLVNSRITVSATIRPTLGQTLKKMYTNKTFAQDQASLIRFLNDEMVIPIMRTADASRLYLYNYIYQFSYKSQAKSKLKHGVDAFYTNIPHGEELKYFWKMGTLSATDRKMSQMLLTMWTSFINAATIEPTPPGSKVLAGKRWLPLEDFSNSITYLDIGDTVRNASVPNYLTIRTLFDKYIGDPKTVYF